MKILVIGSGFIGASVVKTLESKSHELLVYSRRRSESIHCRQILGDIFDFDEFIKVLAWKPQIVIHTAWITTPGVYRNDLSNFKYAQFTTQLATYIAHSSVEHLIVLGTCAEYGYQIGPSTAGITKLSPLTLYAEQKVAAFNSVKELLQLSDMRFTWARIFYPYGPSQNQNRLIPHLIHSLKKREPVVMVDTSSIHDWITTRDIASAISWTISHELPMEIDVGTSFGYTNLEVLTKLEELLQTTNQFSTHGLNDYGLDEVFVTGKDSPLFTSGWSPMDSLHTGLEWVLSV